MGRGSISNISIWPETESRCNSSRPVLNTNAI